MLSAVAGFFLAANTYGFNVWLFLATIIGIALVIGSACVFNNYMDRNIDAYMSRTKSRAMVKKLISIKIAMIYGAVLFLLGFTILAIFTNWLTVLVGFIGFIDYLAFYTPSKKRTVHSTLIGSIAGAMPIVAGYTAVSGKFDGAAFLLFAVMVIWQMPHFYAIAIRRLDEYKSAKLPVLPIKKGVAYTKTQMMFYVAGFIIVTPLLTVFGYTGWFYTLSVLAVGFHWFYLGIQGFFTQKDTAWAKKMFLYSLIVLLTFSSALIANFALP